MLLTKEQILGAEDVKSKIVEVPEWGGSVKVSTMSGRARDMFERSIVAANGQASTDNIRAKLAAATIVAEDGSLLFTEKDIEKLAKKSASALDRVVAAAQELNLITDKDVEAVAKNS